MGLHVAWDGPQIYLQLAALVGVVGLVVWILRRA
jgi:hypothetical protein